MQAQIANLLEEESNIVSVVKLHADGTSSELKIDLSPLNSQVASTLGGNPTFIGMYHDKELVLMKLAHPSMGTPLNKHKLQVPFHKDEVLGDIIITKIQGEGGVPADYHLSDWENFMKEKIDEKDFKEMDINEVQFEDPNIENIDDDDDEEEEEDEDKDDGDEDKDDDDDEEDDDDDNEDEEDEDEDVDEAEMAAEAIVVQMSEAFEKHKGRPPTEEELAAIMQRFYNSFQQVAEEHPELYE